MKKTVSITLLVILSTIAILSLRLGVVFSTKTQVQEIGPLYVAFLQLPKNEVHHQSDGEREILDLTRELYDAKVLKDGHKARAMLIVHSSGNKEAGLLISKNLYEDAIQVRSRFKQAKLKILPKQKMMHASIPRVNVLSLFVGEYKTIPALHARIKNDGLFSNHHIEIYDKRIQYLIPVSKSD